MICGIPGVYLLGEEDDWQNLITKLDRVVEILEPVKDELNIGFLTEAREIFKKLLDTYRGKPDLVWWAGIVSYHYVRDGCTSKSRFDGWFANFYGHNGGKNAISRHPSGLVSTEVKFNDDGGLEDTALFTAGTVGFTVSEEDDSE